MCGKLMTKDEVGELLSHQHFNKLRGHLSKEYLIEKWLCSDYYTLQTIDIRVPSVLIEVENGQKTHSTGAIVLEYNKNRIPHMFNHNNKIDDIIVVDGKHRLTECRQNGDSTIQAYVGNYLKI